MQNDSYLAEQARNVWTQVKPDAASSARRKTSARAPPPSPGSAWGVRAHGGACGPEASLVQDAVPSSAPEPAAHAWGQTARGQQFMKCGRGRSFFCRPSLICDLNFCVGLVLRWACLSVLPFALSRLQNSSCYFLVCISASLRYDFSTSFTKRWN